MQRRQPLCFQHDRFTCSTAGNITGDGQDTYTYYNSGRLKQVTRNGNNLYSLQYNGLGQFVHRTNNNTHYIYDAAGHLIGEYTSNGTPIQETIYLGDTPIAVITPTNQVNYIYTDHLNTPREIRNHANQIRWTWYPEQSGAFGAGLPDDNPNNAIGGQLGTFTYNLRFPGQLYDPASQLSYNYYRDYNPRTGRYIQSDPIGLAGGINTYGYVGANPLSWVDPEGLEKFNLFNPSNLDESHVYSGAEADPDIAGTCIVHAHGNRTFISDQRNGVSEKLKKRLYPKGLNKFLNESGCKDKPVILKSCGTGSGENSLAEKLSKLPHRDGVSAPDKQLWYSDGILGIGAGVNPTPYGKNGNGTRNSNDPGKYRDF